MAPPQQSTGTWSGRGRSDAPSCGSAPWLPEIKRRRNAERPEIPSPSNCGIIFLAACQLAAQGERRRPGVRNDDAEQPQQRGMIVQKVAIHGSGRPEPAAKRVLREIVGGRRRGNRRARRIRGARPRAGGRRLNHGAERRPLLNPELGAARLEQSPDRPACPLPASPSAPARGRGCSCDRPQQRRRAAFCTSCGYSSRQADARVDREPDWPRREGAGTVPACRRRLSRSRDGERLVPER